MNARSTGTTFQPLERGRSATYAACGGIWVMTVVAKPTVPDMLLARPALKTMCERHPDGFPTLTWVLPEAGLSMDADARQAAATVTVEFNRHIRAMATLIEGEGFQPAAVRAIVSGIIMMSRATAPKKVFGTLAPAVDWCVTMRPQASKDAGAADAVTAAILRARSVTS